MPPAVEVVATYDVPLVEQFRGLTRREGMLLRGDAGYGEFSPFWDYGDIRSAPWLRAAWEAADKGWPAPVRDRVPVNSTVPAVGPERAHALVTEAGCTTVKVKVGERGQAFSDDIARVSAVRDALGPAGHIRIDVNGGWERGEAPTRIRALDIAAGGLQYVEQPCASVDDLAHVRRRVDIPIAADESVRNSDDPLRVVRAEAADILVLKVAPLGGVVACLVLAQQVKIPIVVSSALESSVGLAAGVALAAALPELPYACGLGTIRLFGADVTDDPLVPVDGELDVRAVAPAVASLASVRATDETAERWRARYARVKRET